MYDYNTELSNVANAIANLLCNVKSGNIHIPHEELSESESPMHYVASYLKAVIANSV